jgi:hypothetical protein
LVSKRLGRSLPHMTPFDISLNNYKIRELSRTSPYLEQSGNIDVRWPVFNHRAEIAFLLCIVEMHGCFRPVVEIIVKCQECVMKKDNHGLLGQLIRLKSITDELSCIFHKISLNPKSGQNYVNPVDWSRYAIFTSPLSDRVPANSGMHLPLFHVRKSSFDY